METLCEFCSEIQQTEITTIVGSYCIECHEINIEQSQEAIKTIKARVREEKKKGLK